jgi:hypothetical protein
MNQPQLVLPAGTRIVTRSEVRADTERAHRPVGSVAEIIGVPVGCSAPQEFSAFSCMVVRIENRV